MLDTFKARLKAKYPKANLSQKRIDAFADRLHKKFPELTEEADHDAKIDDYYPEEDVMLIAKQDDTIRTLKVKPKDTSDITTQATTTDQQQQQSAPDEPPAWAKSLIGEIQSLKAEKLQSTITQKISSSEKLKEIPANFYAKRRLPEKEEEIDAFVDEVANDYQEFTQHLADKGLSTSVKPPIVNNTNSKEKVSPEMQDYMDRKKPVEVNKN